MGVNPNLDRLTGFLMGAEPDLKLFMVRADVILEFGKIDAMSLMVYILIGISIPGLGIIIEGVYCDYLGITRLPISGSKPGLQQRY